MSRRDRGAETRIPGADGKLVSPEDAVAVMSAAALLIVSVVIAVCLSVFSGYGFCRVFPVTAVPFMAVGVFDIIRDRRYVILCVVVAVSAAFCFVDPYLTLIWLVFTVCAEGVAYLSSVVQRMLFFRVYRRAELYGIKKKPAMSDRVIGFVFGLSGSMDTTRLTADPHIHRNRIPWSDIFGTTMLALFVSMFVWIVVALTHAFDGMSMEVFLAVSVMAVFAVMSALPWVVVRSVDARIGPDEDSFRLYDGLSGTVARMAVPTVLVLAISIVTYGIRIDVFGAVAMSIAAVLAVSAVSSMVYYSRYESGLVNGIASYWSDYRPGDVPKESGGRHLPSLDDGVPGTPERDPRSCLQDRWDQKY